MHFRKISPAVAEHSAPTRFARQSRLARMVLVAAFSIALFPPAIVARADKRHKTAPKMVKKAARKTAAAPAFAAKRLPPQETVSGLKRHIAELKRRGELKRRAEKQDEDADEAQKLKPAGREDESEEDGTDYLQAHLYYLQQRAYPNDSVDWSAYARARKQVELMPAARRPGGGSAQSKATIGNWRFIGPNNLAVPYRTYYGTLPLNGRTNAVAYDPTTPGTYYMATAGGGVFRTTNSGASYTALSDSWATLQTSSIAIDPTNHNTIYVGTGDFDGSGNLPGGLMKTTDGGTTWTTLGKAQFGNSDIAAIAIDPENTQIITVAPGRGPNYYANLWRSTNGGATWTNVLNVGAPWSSLSYGIKDATGKRHLYATGLLYGGKVYRSDDRGATWTKLSPPLTSVNFYDQGSLRIAASATDSEKAYLLDGHDQKIFVGTSAGNSWADTTNNFLTGNSGDAYNWSQKDYDCHIECGQRSVSGVPTDVLYVGLIDLEQSRDGGATWQSIGGPTFTGNAILHNDQHCLALNPNGSGEALVGCDGGMFRLNDNLSTNVFSYSGMNPIGGATQFYRIAAHPTLPNYLLGGAQDNASPALVNNSANWRNVGGGDGGFCAIKDANNQFSTSQFLGLYQTTNAWAGSNYITPNTGGDNVGFIAPIVLDPTKTYLYAGTDHLYRYKISTSSWESSLGGTTLGDTLTAIAIAPSDTTQLYTGASNGQVWWSSNFGVSWKQINTASLPNRNITSVVVSPSNSHSVLVGLSGTGSAHLWMCGNVTTAAPVWTNVSGSGATGLPDVSLNSIALDTFTPASNWYIANDLGVFTTTDAGGHWSNMTAPLGLPNVQVNDLVAVAGTSTLFAGTYGRGIWAITLGTSFRTVSGTIKLEGVPDPTLVNPNSPLDPVVVQFRPVGGGVTLTRTVTLSATGAFSFGDIPAGNYTVAIKASKWLRAVAPANATSGNVTGLSFLLPAGDANNDNYVDATDFNTFVSSYNSDSSFPGSGYDSTADFNCDGIIDPTDFGLFVGNYNTSGAP